MALYNFEGNINGINDRQLEFIYNVIIEHGFKDSKVTFEQVGKDGDNYAAIVKRIIIEGENKTLKLIAKVLPASEYLRATMNISSLFKNEHIMYTEFLPMLLELQKEADVSEEDHFKFAKCYGSLIEEPNEIILLEDLNTLDFVMLDRFESLSDECVKSVLKNFATLHSISYVLKKKEPEKFNYFKANLSDTWLLVAENEEFRRSFTQLESTALALLKEPKYQNAIRHTIGDFLTPMVKMAKLEASNKYSVIQQGDAWTNNIMFRFQEGNLKESIMIDYQLSKNTNPVADLMYMIFNCTDHETRSKHYYDWIDYYHAELDKSLSNFGMKAIYEYPREQLDADLRRYSKVFFSLCTFLASTLTLTPEEAGKMKQGMETGNVAEMVGNASMSFLSKDTLTRFKKRLVGLIDSFLEFGLL